MENASGLSRAFRFRLYPNRAQVEQIEATYRACRWIWNRCLEIKDAAYKNDGKSLNSTQLCKLITMYKRTGVGEWISVAPNSALQQSVRDLDAAYKNFFRRVKRGEAPGFPKYKRPSGAQSYRTPAGGRLDKSTGSYVGQCVAVIDERHVKLPKLGTVKCRITQMPEGHILSATVSRNPAGHYFVSLCCENVPYPKVSDGSIDVMGVRVGVDDMMTCSDGVRVKGSKALSKSMKKLRREQRRLSRRKKGSANWKKQKLKVARVHERVHNQRQDAIHKATTRVVRDSRAVAVSSYSVKDMTRKVHGEGRSVQRKRNRALLDASTFEVTRQLEYKCEWNRRAFIKVDSSSAFTRTCRVCGERHEGKIGKQWTCRRCGTTHDTAMNAARNIARAGSRELARI